MVWAWDPPLARLALFFEERKVFFSEEKKQKTFIR
jgi:hypothetical protein